MRIIHIITGLNEGGVQAILFSICKKDSKQEHIIISMDDGGKYGIMLSNLGLKVYNLNINPNRIRLNDFRKLAAILKSCQPDLIQTWMYHADFFGGITSRLLGFKNIFWCIHNSHLSFFESKISTILIFRINSFLSKIIPKKIIYCAEKSKIIHEHNGFAKHKSIVINNGYDTRDFYPSESLSNLFRKAHQIDSKTFLIGVVGRYNPQKDYKTLLLSLSQVKKSFNFSVIMVGANLDLDNYELKKQISESNLTEEIILLGSQEDILSVMNGIDLLVLSSSSEAFSNVLNEAMACCTPCVSTNAGDSELIIGNTGWLSPIKNPNSLAKKIIEAIFEKTENHHDWIKRKKLCREHIVNNFSIEKMIDSYVSIWHSSINK